MDHQNVTNGNLNVDNANMRGNPAPTLGQIVGFFKYGVSKRINCIRKTPGVKLWQRNYYEHIVRNNNEYGRIVKYIENNPREWELDSLNSGINSVVDAGSPCTNTNNTHSNTTNSNVGNPDTNVDHQNVTNGNPNIDNANMRGKTRTIRDQMRVLIDNKPVKGIRLTE